MALALSLALIGCRSAPVLPVGAVDRPDIIILSVDTLRADHLGAWGYERDTSPFFDQMAKEGARFGSAWSPSPWTLPAHATLLSGALPKNHGAIESDLRISDQTPLLAEAFSEAGYLTAGVVSTLFVTKKYGFDRGFSHFHDFEIDTERKNLAGTVDAEQVFAHAMNWGSKQPAGQPIFLFMHLYDVHYSYDPPAPWNLKFDRAPKKGDLRYKNYFLYKKKPVSTEQMAHQVAQYDEEIAYVDAAFKAFVGAWTAKRKAIVILVSDHGEEFGERGSWGHAHTLGPEQLHVPFIVWGDGVKPRDIPDRVGLEDVAPTVASLAGVPFTAPDGRDLTPAFSGEPLQGEGAVFAETSRFKTLRVRWHSAPYDLDVNLRTGAVTLCHLEQDPMCEKNIAQQHPEVSQRLQSELWSWLGQPWSANRPLQMRSDGVFLKEGVRHPGRLTLDRPADFSLLPADAVLTVGSKKYSALDATKADGSEGLLYSGAAGGVGVDLSDLERARLRALGYIE